MPAATAYSYDPSSPEGRAIDEAHAKEYDERSTAFALRWAYYNGQMRAPLALQSDGVNDNVLLPKVDQVVDKVVSFLLGDGVTFDGDGDDATDEAIEAIWQASGGAQTQHRLAMHGAVSGHVFARVEPREGTTPRIVALNPAHVSVFWDAIDVTRILWYRLQYRAGYGSGKRVDYVRESALPDGGTSDDVWYELVYGIPASGSMWALTAGPTRLDNCPIVDWQNLPNPVDFYGFDDASKALALNDALNFAASNYQRIIKHYGSPKTIGLGFDVQEDVKTETGDLITINKTPAEADVKYLEMRGDMTAVREWLGTLEREIWQSARMLDPQAMRDKVGALTNFGLRVLYTDALHKTDTKRQLYGDGFERINRLALALAGITPPEHIETVWPDPLPVDDTAETANLQIDQSIGAISKETYREKRGYDNEREVERLETEQSATGDLGTQLLRAFESGNAARPPMQPQQAQPVPAEGEGVRP